MTKTIAITGGTKGIGAGIAKAFTDAGWSVFISARNDNGFAGEIGATFFAMNVQDRDAHDSLAMTAIEQSGRLDGWINAAGYSAWRPIEEIDPAFMEDMIATNLNGTLWGAQAAAARLTDGGVIVNVSSLAGKRGSAMNTAYCATKFAVNGVTQSLAKELGPRGIRVNAVCPVYVETPGVLEALEDPRSPADGQKVADYLADFRDSQTALKRLPQDHEVGATCLYLASDAASAITGQCINVDCGVLPQ